MFTIYLASNLLNKKRYVGFTSNTKEIRWKQHIKESQRKRCRNHFHCAIRKYGPKNFLLETLEEGWDPKIGKDIREPYWISVLKPEYNHTAGGEGFLGCKTTRNKANLSLFVRRG